MYVFQKGLLLETFATWDESNHKPSKIWVDKDSEFFNKSIKSWLQHNGIEVHSTFNDGKSIVVERSNRTFKNKIHKYLTSVSKNVYIDKLDDIVHEYNHTYHDAIKMKATDVNSSTYIDLNEEKMMKILNLTLVTMQKYQNRNTFCKRLHSKLTWRSSCNEKI